MDHELTTTPDQEHPKEGKRWGGGGGHREPEPTETRLLPLVGRES